MTNRDDGHATKSSGIKTLFAMVITRILFGYGGAVEDLLGQGKIQAVLFKIAFAFGFCPCVVHSLHYIYERMYLIALIRCKKGDRSLPFLFLCHYNTANRVVLLRTMLLTSKLFLFCQSLQRGYRLRSKQNQSC